MTPHAGRPPALPVVLLCSWPPLPRSSVPACTTNVRCPGDQQPAHGAQKEVREGKTYTQHAILADQLDLRVRHGALGVALGVGLEVAQVADVALGVGGRAVGLGEGVDCGIGSASGLDTVQETMERGGPSWRGNSIQWGPAEVQPLVLSPNWWTCMPRYSLVSVLRSHTSKAKVLVQVVPRPWGRCPGCRRRCWWGRPRRLARR